MKNLMIYLLSFIFFVGPYSTSFADEFERTNLVGVDETTERFIGEIERERAAGSTGSSSGGSRPSTSSTQTPANNCAPGEIYNTFSKKCIGSEESRKLNAEADQECNVLSDPQLRARCAASRVEEKTTRAENNGDMAAHSDKVKKINLLPLVLAFTTLYAAILHLITKGPNCPASKSSYLMIGGAVTLILTEFMTQMQFSKDLKKSQKELEAIVNGSKSKDSDNKNATDLQVEVFEALIKREDGVIKAANGKKKGYNLAKLMFIGATIAAGIETVKYFKLMATVGGAPTAEALYSCKDAVFADINLFDSKFNRASRYVDYLIKTNDKVSFNAFESKLYNLDLSSAESFQANVIDSLKFSNGDNSSVSLTDFFDMKKSSQNPEFKILDHAITLIKNVIAIPNAEAAAPAAAAITKVVNIKAAEAVGLKKLFLLPVTRLVLSGMMTAVTFTLTGHADKEIKKANKRKEVLEKLKGQVSEAGPVVKCANGTEQGTAGCEQVAPTTVRPGESTFSLAATQPNGSANTRGRSAFNDAKGCASSNGQPDPDCGCKKTNSCFSMGSNFQIGDANASDILGNGINDVNALTNGSISPAGLDNSALERQLAAAGKMRDKLLSQMDKDPKIKAEIGKAQDTLNKMQNQIYNNMPALVPRANTSLTGSDSDLSGLSGNQVLEQVKEELKEASAQKVTNEVAAGSGESDFNFDIGTADPMDVGTGLTEGEAKGNVNINDFELAESEINPSSTTNIFEILSSRYKKSAFRRLLKADKEIAPEAPAEKEIND